MNKDCSTCICKEGSCYPSTTIFDKDKTCKSYEPDYESYITELEKENAELKEKYVKNITDCDICDTYCNSQLTKAKEIINDCVCELQNILFYKMRNKERIASTLDKAEQFLSEVEK